MREHFLAEARLPRAAKVRGDGGRWVPGSWRDEQPVLAMAAAAAPPPPPQGTPVKLRKKDLVQLGQAATQIQKSSDKIFRILSATTFFKAKTFY